MDGVIEVLNAPWTTVLTLAGGYAGYFVAHVGARDHHQQIDQVFRVVFYGFWGVFAYLAARAYCGIGILPASLLCIAVAAMMGGAWRRWGQFWFARALRITRVSLSDDLPTAWSALAEAGHAVEVSQLKVRLVDGSMLFCNDLDAFKDMPNGPCVLGSNGDILMYVTNFFRPEDGWSPAEAMTVAGYGTMISYVPREQIARVDLRRLDR